MLTTLNIVIPTEEATQDQIDDMINVLYQTIVGYRINRPKDDDWIKGSPIITEENKESTTYNCTSVLEGWQTKHMPTQQLIGPSFNKITDLWEWQRDNLNRLRFKSE